MHGRLCKRYIFRSYDIWFIAMHFDENPSTSQCEKDQTNKQTQNTNTYTHTAFQILLFYGSFSNDITAVKGLIKLQSFIQCRMRLKRSEFAWKQRIALYSCHCEALSAHLQMRHSRRVHIIN